MQVRSPFGRFFLFLVVTPQSTTKARYNFALQRQMFAASLAKRLWVKVAATDRLSRLGLSSGCPPRLHPLDVRLRRPGGEHERGVAGVEMGHLGDLVGHQRAAAAACSGQPDTPGSKKAR